MEQRKSVSRKEGQRKKPWINGNSKSSPPCAAQREKVEVGVKLSPRRRGAW